MNHRQLVRALAGCASGILALALVACDNGGDSGGGGSGTGNASSSGNTSSSGNASSSGSNTSSSGSNTSSSGSTSNAIVCATNYCSSVGMGGYAFSYSDSDPPSGTGTSKATLAADGSLCITGNTMALPPNTTPAEYSADWGCGIGVNLNQAMGMNTPEMSYTMTGSGVTVNVSNLPSCAQARVVLDQGGMNPVCAALTPGVAIPWSAFNTTCWTTGGTALSGPPSSQSIKVQFVTSPTECDFSNFCLTQISL